MAEWSCDIGRVYINQVNLENINLKKRMGQEEILLVLEKEGKPLSRREIAIKINCQEKNVSNLLKQLVKFEEVKCLEIPRDLAMKMYKCKRRMRLYYVT